MSTSRKAEPVDCTVYALADLMLYKDSFWKDWAEPKYCIAFAKRILAGTCGQFYHTVGAHWMTPCTEAEYEKEQEEFADFWEARSRFEESRR